MTDLRRRMIKDMQLRNFTTSTQKAYVSAVALMARHFARPPDRLSESEIQDYVIYLSTERKLALGSCRAAVTALRFFYTVTLKWDEARFPIPPVRRAYRLPEILSAQEVERLIAAATRTRDRVLLMTTYGGGLRVGEATRLTARDIHSDRMMIRVDQGKGRKDRYTLLSPRMLEELRSYWKTTRPPVWLFSGREPQQPMPIRTAQRIYVRARDGAGIDRRGGIHTLRHCFATHLLEAGIDVRTIQLLMGHRSILSTMRYLQVTRKTLEGTPNPLDLLQIPGKPMYH